MAENPRVDTRWLRCCMRWWCTTVLGKRPRLALGRCTATEEPVSGGWAYKSIQYEGCRCAARAKPLEHC